MAGDGTRTERVELRMEPAEKEAFQLAASVCGLGLSAWMRERLRRAAKCDLEEAGEHIAFATTKKKAEK